MDTGYIKIHRKITDWEWYHDLPVFRLFTHLLFAANWKDKRWKGIEVKRGQLVSGRKVLSEMTGLTEQQVRTALSKLKDTQEITSESTKVGTLYTVVKYSTYQDEPDTTNQRSNQAPTKHQPKSNQASTTTKERKKERKEEGKSMSHPFASEAVTRWNTFASNQPNLATVKTISKSRSNKLNTRIKEGLTMEQFVKALEEVAGSDFLLGLSGGWAVSFDWLITNDSNLLKVVEGNYRNKEQSSTRQSAPKQFETAQERRNREIDEQTERMMKKLGGAPDDFSINQAADSPTGFTEAKEVL